MNIIDRFGVFLFFLFFVIWTFIGGAHDGIKGWILIPLIFSGIIWALLRCLRWAIYGNAKKQS